MRYLEERSLREVAGVLGVDEDAARKRVARALDRLCTFFRQRGFEVPVGAAAAGILAGSTQAAPALVAASALQAGLAAGTAATGFNLIWLHIMALTKTQTALLCAVLAAAPLVWQKRAEAHVARQRADLAAQLASSARQADQVGNGSMSVGGVRQLEEYVPRHLLPFFQSLQTAPPDPAPEPTP